MGLARGKCSVTVNFVHLFPGRICSVSYAVVLGQGVGEYRRDHSDDSCVCQKDGFHISDPGKNVAKIDTCKASTR